MEHLHSQEKVILVGNSIGGISIALAAERYPEKVKAAVFLGAFIPDTKHHPSYIIEQFKDNWVPDGFWKDTTFRDRTDSKCKQVVLLGPDFLSSNIYNLSPKEDALLAGLLMRPSSFFLEDLSKEPKLTDKNYGSVDRVVIIAENGPKAITKDFNTFQMTNAGEGFSFETIEEADDMAMISKPEEVARILLDNIATS